MKITNYYEISKQKLKYFNYSDKTILNYLLTKKWFISSVMNSHWYKSKHVNIKICDKCGKGEIKHHIRNYGIGFTYDICNKCYATWNEDGEYMGIPEKKVLGLTEDNAIVFDYS